MILASWAARHLPAHQPDTRQLSRGTPARSSAWYSPAESATAACSSAWYLLTEPRDSCPLIRLILASGAPHLPQQFLGWGQIRPRLTEKARETQLKRQYSTTRHWEFCHFPCCCIWSCHTPQRQAAQSELELMICTHLLQGAWGQHLKDSPMLINWKQTRRLGERSQMGQSKGMDGSIG